MPYSNIQSILSDIPKLKLLLISRSQHYGNNLQGLQADFAILDDIVSSKLRDLTGFHCHLRVISIEISSESVNQLLHMFPTLRHIRSQVMWNIEQHPSLAIVSKKNTKDQSFVVHRFRPLSLRLISMVLCMVSCRRNVWHNLLARHHHHERKEKQETRRNGMINRS